MLTCGPLIFLALAAALVVYAGVSAPYYLKNEFFLVPCLYGAELDSDSTFAFNFNGAAWSVSTEVFFYLLFPCLVQLKDKHRNALIGGAVGGVSYSISLLWGSPPPPCRLAALYQPCIPSGGISLGNMAVRPIPHWPFRALQQKERHHYGGVAVLILVCSIGIAMSAAIGWQWRWQIFYTIPNRYSHLRFQL